MLTATSQVLRDKKPLSLTHCLAKAQSLWVLHRNNVSSMLRLRKMRFKAGKLALPQCLTQTQILV